MKLSTNYFKIVQLDYVASTANTLTSIKALDDLVNTLVPKRHSSGLVRGDEHFIFGVSKHIYGHELTGQSGFISSLTHYRKTNFFVNSPVNDP